MTLYKWGAVPLRTNAHASDIPVPVKPNMERLTAVETKYPIANALMYSNRINSNKELSCSWYAKKKMNAPVYMHARK